MQSRRQLLLSAGAMAALAGCASTAEPVASTTAPAAPPTPAAPDAAAQLAKYLDQVFEQALDDSPQLVTGLGLDTGARAPAKWKLDSASLDEKAKQKALNTEQLRQLKAIDRSQLSGMAAVNYDSLMFSRQTSEAANQINGAALSIDGGWVAQ